MRLPKTNWWLGRTSFVLLLLSSLVVAETPVGKQHPSRPNVILVTIDTVRADHLHCYGYNSIETPTLDALSQDGVLFERALSQVPLTWPSHVVILTGTYPYQNGVQDFTSHPLAPDVRSVAQAFQQSGYATGAVVSSFALDRSWGLARGFDYYDDAFSPDMLAGKDIGLVERRAGDSVTAALAWLRKTRARPFFLWLHLYDPHSPYDPPEPYRTRYRDHLYDGEIAYADHELSRLISRLKETKTYSGSLIVVLSDHGESLGEHGESEHGFFVYNSSIRVPLIIKPPAGARISRKRVDAPVEIVAIAPTLLRLAGLHDRMDKQLQTGSLFQSAAPQNESAYSETFYPFSSFGWSPLHALETKQYHYIEAPKAELYDLEKDPQEDNNIAAQHPEITAVLQEKLKAQFQNAGLIQTTQVGEAISQDAAQKLRALGYAAYQSPVSKEALAKELPDPKDKLAEFNSMLRAQDAFRASRFSEGTDLLRKVAEQDPQMYVVPFLLGEAAIRQADWTEAAANFRRCLELNPGFEEGMTGLAHALHAQGNDAEAKMWLNKAVHANTQNYRAWYELGALEATTNPAAALESYRQAVLVQPSFAAGQRELGILELKQKQYRSASEHLQHALELGADDAHVRNFLGIAYTQTGRLELAVASLQQAIRLDPTLAEPHLNLGYAYQKMHKPDASKVEYEAACRLQSRFCGVSINTN